MGSVSKVYFTREITPENVVKLYETLGKKLEGNVAVKVHSGEEGNQNYLKPEFWRPVVEKVNGTVVECNTAYGGERNTTYKHLRLLKNHGWNELFDVDLMDYDHMTTEPDEFSQNQKKNPDAWGVKLQDDNFVGPNLLGRLLMELRDNGKLDYTLPADALSFIDYL